MRALALSSAIGFDVAIVLLVCVLIGHYADTRLHSSPWGLLIGVLVGLAGGVASAYRMIKLVFYD